MRIPARHRRPWTDREDIQVKGYSLAGMLVEEIALAQGRSTEAIIDRLERLKVPMQSRTHSHRLEGGLERKYDTPKAVETDDDAHVRAVVEADSNGFLPLALRRAA